MDIKQKDKKYVLGTYARYDLLIVRGAGAECEDETGKKYIDLGSGIGVNALGYCDCGWIKAVEEQLETLQHTSNLYYTAPCALLAEALCERTGYKKVFFCNSGAERFDFLRLCFGGFGLLVVVSDSDSLIKVNIKIVCHAVK